MRPFLMFFFYSFRHIHIMNIGEKYIMKQIHDVLIIGAGVTGTMIARELSKYFLDVVILDKNNDAGDATSSANSAIIHSGYDPEPGSLKAKFNVLGNAKYPKLVEELDVPFIQCGSLTIATEDQGQHRRYGLRRGNDQLLHQEGSYECRCSLYRQGPL